MTKIIEQHCINCGHKVQAAISHKIGDLGEAAINAKRNKRYACISSDLEMVIVFAQNEDYTKGSCECWCPLEEKK